MKYVTYEKSKTFIDNEEFDQWYCVEVSEYNCYKKELLDYMILLHGKCLPIVETTPVWYAGKMHQTVTNCSLVFSFKSENDRLSFILKFV
jgi:hypothetical protein